MSSRTGRPTPLAGFAHEIDGLASDLAAVESELGCITCCSVTSVNDIGNHLRAAGGKRIRPLLVLLSARMFGYRGLDAHKLGAIVEAIHTATLAHDDVIDDAGLRRGRRSTNAVWGNTRSVLAGDWIFMQAFRVALTMRNLAILDVLIDLTQRMVEGEILQMETLGTMISRKDYLSLVERKTASLFAGCANLGSMVAGATRSQQERLSRYGRHLGIAFQLADDVLDLVGSEVVLGKPPGSDLRDGRATLPILDAFARGTMAEQGLLNTVLRERGFGSVSRSDVLALLERYGSIASTIQFARQHADSARQALAEFEESESKQALLFACDLVVMRDA